MKKLLLTVAPNGNKWTRDDTPYIPITAQESSSHGIAAVKAGASIIHIHARDDRGGPTHDPKYFAPILEAYRKNCPEAVLEMSVGAMEGRADTLLEPLLKLRPDCASFNLKGTEEETALMFELFNKYNVKPVFEVFSEEMAAKVKRYVAEGLVKKPVVVNLVFDLTESGRSFSDYNKMLTDVLQYFPEDWIWSVNRGAASEQEIGALAMFLGGNVRTGLEDTLYAEPGVLAKDSAELIERCVKMAKLFHREIATPAEARAAYGLI